MTELLMGFKRPKKVQGVQKVQEVQMVQLNLNPMNL
jgi:hypothetical protein